MTERTDGWVQTPWHVDMHYSALAGIPFARPVDAGNITFQIQSCFWEFENATLRELGSSVPLLETAATAAGSCTLTNYTAASEQWQFALPANRNYSTSSAIPISFEVS